MFRIATAHEKTVGELIEALLSVLETKSIVNIVVRFEAKRDGDVTRNCPDIAKAKGYLHWQARASLVGGLKSTIKYFVENSTK